MQSAHHGPIALAAYDPNWPTQFALEALAVKAALGASQKLVEHVGSTSIPGMPAKPILDILLGVHDSRDEALYVPPLVERGYWLHLREPDWQEHRLLKRSGPAVHLHVFSEGAPEIERMI